MTAPIVTLQDYQRAERAIAHEGARGGLMVHSIVTVVVSVALVVVNFTLADEFPWSAFAVVGMSIGLAAHWWFGRHNLDTELTARQHMIEERAADLH